MFPNNIPQTSPINWLFISILLISFILISNSKNSHSTLDNNPNKTTNNPINW